MLRELIGRQRAGWSLEQPFYMDPAVFQAERRAWLSRQWFLLGHCSELPSHGAHIVREVLGESILIIRDRKNRIRGFYNVCRHRGARLCTADARNRLIVCPYHAWTYELDGRLVKAPAFAGAVPGPALDLLPVKIELIGGLIFCSLSDDALQTGSLARDLGPVLAHHGLASAKIAARQAFSIKANWKLVIENFLECYHCRPTHPQYCAVNGYTGVTADDDSTKAKDWEKECARWWFGIRATGGLDASVRQRGSHEQLSYSAERRPIGGGRKTLSEDGEPVAPLMGSFQQYDGGETIVSFGAFAHVDAANDHALLVQVLPQRVDQTNVVATWLVAAHAEEPIDRGRLSWMWNATLEQDQAIIERNGLGVASEAYRPGPYTSLECETSQFVSDYLEQLRDLNAEVTS